MAMKSSAGASAAIAAWKAFGSVVQPDLLATQKMVRALARPLAEAAHHVGVRASRGCAARARPRWRHRPPPPAQPKTCGEQVRREARARPCRARRRAGSRPRGCRGRSARSSSTRPLICAGAIEPAEPRGELLGRLVPDAPTGEPSFAHRRSATRSRTRPSRRAATAASISAAVPAAAHAGASALRWLSIVADQLVERLRERCHALGDQLVGDGLHADPLAPRRRAAASRAASRSRSSRRSTRPWSRNASIVSIGIVLTVCGPISSSTYRTSR